MICSRTGKGALLHGPRHAAGVESRLPTNEYGAPYAMNCARGQTKVTADGGSRECVLLFPPISQI